MTRDSTVILETNAVIVTFARTACERIPSTRAELYVEGNPERQEASKDSDSPLRHVGLADD
jgi:hypothetical protein